MLYTLFFRRQNAVGKEESESLLVEEGKHVLQTSQVFFFKYNFFLLKRKQCIYLLFEIRSKSYIICHFQRLRYLINNMTDICKCVDDEISKYGMIHVRWFDSVYGICRP